MESATVESTPTAEPWSLRDLPPFPWIATKVLQLFSAPAEQVEAKRLTELIRADASLSSELLRRANSAMFGLRSQVSTVDHAIAMLGFNRVKSLAMTLGVGTYVRASLKLTVLRRCWRHSLGCALLAEELADSCQLDPDRAYTAGLLHDVGRLALLVKYPQSYADLLSVVIENRFSMLKSERDLFDLDHCEAGAWLAQEWDFPDELVTVIAEHHNPCKDDSFNLLRLIHLSCRLAESLGFEVAEPAEAEEPHRIREELPQQAWRVVEDVEALRERITEKANALE